MPSWLSPKLEIRKSHIHGLGLFARARIEVGEVCARIEGRVVDDADLDEIVRRGRPYSGFALGGGRHVVQDDDDLTRFGNHSCEPTLAFADARALVAVETIEAGAEATVDYAPISRRSWTMQCRCGAPSCRGTITGTR